MKLQIVSDLHMEFRDPPNIINAGADVLLLAGDICLVDHLYKNPNTYALPSRGVYAKDATRYRDFFNHVSQEFDSVYYVLGNHEYYQGRWNNTVERLRSELEPWPNIVLMDNTWINIGDTRIIGTSLWTDLNNANPLVMEGVSLLRTAGSIINCVLLIQLRHISMPLSLLRKVYVAGMERLWS